jgi:hypothetical protein
MAGKSPANVYFTINPCLGTVKVFAMRILAPGLTNVTAGLPFLLQVNSGFPS